MADTVQLWAERRTVTGKKVKQLRRKGILPANITGHHMSPVAIQVEGHALERLLKENARTTLIKLTIASGDGNTEQTALIGRVQRHPVSRAIEHVDFLHVEMNQAMRVRVPLHTEGESAAVKNGDGILLHLLNDLEVEALPADLPQAITVDVSGLANVDDALYVRDLRLPPRVKLVHSEPDEPVIKVVVTRAAIEEAAAEAPAAEAAEAAPAAEGAATPTAASE
jgi:large subunit ribosomal protein L25